LTNKKFETKNRFKLTPIVIAVCCFPETLMLGFFGNTPLHLP